MDRQSQTHNSPEEFAARQKLLRRIALEDLKKTKYFEPRFYKKHRSKFFYATLWENFDDFSDFIKVKHPQLFRIFRHILDNREARRNRLPSWLK